MDLALKNYVRAAQAGKTITSHLTACGPGGLISGEIVEEWRIEEVRKNNRLPESPGDAWSLEHKEPRAPLAEALAQIDPDQFQWILLSPATVVSGAGKVTLPFAYLRMDQIFAWSPFGLQDQEVYPGFQAEP